MFNSQSLISRKGVFGVIWVAAHCLKRLKKHDLMQTDVNHSVVNILEVGVPAVNHRILAFLLLGVVRIYSKKVEFLFHDCCDVLEKVGLIQGGKEASGSIEALRKTYGFVSLPERFELDAFDLEILEDQNVVRENVRSHEDMTPSDALGGRKKRLNDKHHVVECTASAEPYFSAYTPVRDVHSPCFVNRSLDMEMLCDKGNLKSSLETRYQKFFSDERMEPLMLNYAEKDTSYDMLYSTGSKTNTEHTRHPDSEVMCEEEREEIILPDEEKGSTENSCGIGCFSEQQEPLHFEDVEESDLVFMSHDGCPSDGDMMKHVDSTVNNGEPEELIRSSFKDKNNGGKKKSQSGIGCFSEERLEHLCFEDAEESDLVLLSHDGCQSDVDMMKHVDSTVNVGEPEELIRSSVTEKNNRGKEKSQYGSIFLPDLPEEKQPLSINTDVASNSMFPGAPDSIAIPTPSTKELSSLLKKRKCFFDGSVVFSNKIIKKMVDDSSDLVCKRRKAPYSALQAWKAQKISSLPTSLMEPLIPCKAIDFGLNFRSNMSEVMETEFLTTNMTTNMETEFLTEFRSNMSAVKYEDIPPKQASIKFLTTFGSDEEAPIAPGTPISYSSSARLQEVLGLSRCDTLRPSSSHDSFEELFRQDEAQELDSSLTDKKSSPNGDKVEIYEYSARTRRVASYLLKNFVKQRKLKGDETVRLSQIVESKSKGESARLFHEILVLKSGDFINVRQENGYADIILEETPKLKDFVSSKA